MRAIAVIVFIAIVQLNTYGQKISLTFTNEKIENIFKEIRKQSKHDFLYNDALISNLKPVSINVKNANVESVLDSLLLNSQLMYSIQERLVMISRKDMVAVKQESFTISGIVKDKEGRPMPGAAVLLGNYKIGTVAGDDGRFVLKGIKPGNYNILVEMIGYLPANHSVLISNNSAEVEILLIENVKLLSEVVIRADPNRSKYLKMFKKSFIGTSENAEDCEILNPEVLYVRYDPHTQILSVSADELLVIENKSLGYRIKYLLKYFERDEQTNVVVFYGYPYFEELRSNGKAKRKHLKRRKAAYVGSPQHFFRALYHNKTAEEGFILNDLIKAPNHQKSNGMKLLDSVAVTKSNLRIKGKVWTKKDSLAYRSLLTRESDTLEVLVRKDVEVDDLIKSTSGPLKTIDLKEALYITFTGEKESKHYVSSGYRIRRPDDLTPFQVSLFYQLRGSIGFYENGALYDPGSVLYEGVWGYEKVADMVPLDYTLYR